MKSLKLLYYRFKVIKRSQALELGLEFSNNVHGDAINHLNCRSIWVDSKGRTYRVHELEKTKHHELCKCGWRKIGGYSCQRTDCNQNI